MSLHADESKHISFSLSQIERLCQVAKALSSPLRVKMIGLLASRSMNVNELAEALSMPVSTAALNVRQLEEAGLISTEIQPGIRGAMKLCSRRIVKTVRTIREIQCDPLCAGMGCGHGDCGIGCIDGDFRDIFKGVLSE